MSAGTVRLVELLLALMGATIRAFVRITAMQLGLFLLALVAIFGSLVLVWRWYHTLPSQPRRETRAPVLAQYRRWQL